MIRKYTVQLQDWGPFITTWLLSVHSFFRFVWYRKTARKYGILPDLTVFLAVLVSVVLLTAAVYDYFDPKYFEWFYAKLWHHDRTSIFYHTTDIGKSDWILWGTGSVLLFISIYRLAETGTANLIRLNHLFLKVYFIFTAVAFSGILAILAKIFIGRARPVATMPEHTEWHSLPFDLALMQSSFPSGHSTTIAALCMACWFLMPRLGLFFVALALWVGISRLVVGAHFPSDVVAGLSFGAIFTWLHARNFARKRLLFKFDENGRVKMRNASAKRARRRLQAQVSKPGTPKTLGAFLQRAF